LLDPLDHRELIEMVKATSERQEIRWEGRMKEIGIRRLAIEGVSDLRRY
jgi:hypothetical protein